MRQSKLMVAVACVGLAVAVSAPMGLYAADQPTPPAGTPAHHPKHPEMHSALHSLRQAHVTLQTAAHDFGGHRKAALKLTEEAAAEVVTALKLDNDLPAPPTTRPTVPPTKVEDKAAAEKQVQQARGMLQTAEEELKKSAHDFEGHRLKAIHLTEEAIKEVDEGLAVNK